MGGEQAAISATSPHLRGRFEVFFTAIPTLVADLGPPPSQQEVSSKGTVIQLKQGVIVFRWAFR